MKLQNLLDTTQQFGKHKQVQKSTKLEELWDDEAEGVGM